MPIPSAYILIAPGVLMLGELNKLLWQEIGNDRTSRFWWSWTKATLSVPVCWQEIFIEGQLS